MSKTEQINIDRLRRQVFLDRLVARLFREDPAGASPFQAGSFLP